MTLGLAEVEERLRLVQRRLNTFTAAQAVCVGLSVTIFTIAAVLILGLRGSAAAFRCAAWAGLLVSLVTLVGCSLFAARRWLDVAATAQLADRRGNLTDRLATLIDLRTRPRPSRLAPILVAQVLALGAKWEPQRLVPRRFPRALFALVAALLLLGSTPLLAPPPPPPAPASLHGATTAPLDASAEAPTSATQLQNTGSQPDAAGSGTDAPQFSVRVAGANDAASAGLDDTETSPDPHESLVGALPDQLRQAIRNAFHLNDSPAQRQQAAAERNGSAGRASSDQSGRQPDPHAARGQGDHGDDTEPPAADALRQPANASTHGQQMAQQPSDPAATDPPSGGAAPGAGSGSNPSGVMGQAVGARVAPNAPKSYQLAIGSLLHGVDRQGAPPRRRSQRTGTVSDIAESNHEPLPLSDRQLKDDALHKANVPPEYEDLVRRVYSSRGDQ